MESTITISRKKAKLKDYISLTKAILSFAVGVPGVLVYLLVAKHITVDLWLSILAIFLLALGVSALNQFQERSFDALMPRTMTRPLITGTIGIKEALAIVTALIGISMIVEYYVLGFLGVLIFAFVVFLYNGVYTPMKRVSAYAVFPGAILGMIPPMLCWMAAGQGLLQPYFFALAWFYFIWQIPHFWLLVLMYQKDYNKAKFPNMANVVGAQSLSRITYVWILLTIVSALIAVTFFMPKSNITLAFILLHSAFMAYKGFPLLKSDTWQKKIACRKIFMQLNIYSLAVIVYLVIDKWFV